jgi:hypothetical protein
MRYLSAASIGLGCGRAWWRLAVAAGVTILLVSVPLVASARTRDPSAGDVRSEPSRQIALSAGTFDGVSLGQTVAEVRRALPGSVDGSPAQRVTPLDASSAPIGVSYFPGDVRSVRARGVSLLAERGRVRMMFITDPRAVTLGGVRIGDDLREARARLSGLLCHQSNEDVPACGGRVGRFTAIFVGDPIQTITLSSIDTGWCFVRSDTCHSTTRTVQIEAR